MMVTWMSDLARALAAFSPPNPPPTITTRTGASFVILLICTPVYKIHAMPDGSRSYFAADPKENTMPAWARWVMPSASDLIFVAILMVLLLTPLAVKLLGDAGIGWHIRTGQQILATHAIPRTDPFSSTMGGKPWFAWEWLFDLVAGELDHVAGLNGVTWMTAVIIAGVFGWMFRLLIRR